MKTITRFFLLAVAIVTSTFMGFAAQSTIDFETVGNTWTWSTFEFAPAWSIVANPSSAGINTSAHVGKLVVNPTDQPWAGVQCAKSDFGPLTINASSNIIKIMVYKDVISPVGIKLVTATDASKGEIKVSNTKINEWEELTFDFTGQIDPNFTYNGIVVFTDFPASRTAGSTTYIDNIVYTKNDVASDTEAPTVFTATAGTISASSVILKLNANDNSGTLNYTISYGNTVLNTTGTSGVEKLFLVSGLTPSTAYDFSVVCKDVAGNNAANNPIVVNASTTAASTATSTIEFETIGNAWLWSTFEAKPTWSVVENPFSTGINTSAHVAKIVVNPTDQPWAGAQCAHGDFGPMTVTASSSIIKMMVYKDVISPVGIKLVIADGGSQGELKVSNTKINEWEELTFDFTPQIRAGWVIDQIVIFPDFPASRTAGSTTYIDNIVYTPDAVIPDNEIPTAFTATAGAVSSSDVVLKLNATDNSGNVKYTITYGTTVLNTSGTSATEKLFTITGLDAATAYNFSVVCKDAAGNAAANNPIVVAVTTSAAMVAAATPTLSASNVISLFSDAYTNINANFDPGWGGGPISDVLVSGNATKKYDAFTYKGVQFAAAVDASSMTGLHIDIYPTSETSIKISPINTSKGGTLKQNDTSVGTLIPNQWNSIDIPLSTIGVDMTAVDQFIFSGGTSGSFYMDNLYFWKVSTGINEVAGSTQIRCYPNPAVNNLTISAQSNISEITVRNLIGQSIKTEIVNGTSKTIDLSGLASGNYFLVAKMNNGMISTQKFSKL
jgi:uncharacterized protein (DUF39 family)